MPVPAAITAAFPPGTAMPCCNTANSDGSYNRHRVSQRLEVVDHFDAFQPQSGGYSLAVNEPRDVRQSRHLIGDRAGDADARGRDGARIDFPRTKELAHHRLEPVVVERDELTDFDRLRTLGIRGEQTEQRFCAADVARQ